MRIAFVHNPSSGSAEQNKDAILSVLREAGHEAVYLNARDADASAVLKSAPELVVIAGGDGTVGSVAKGLTGRGVPIAVVPHGTANNIATALGVSEDLRVQAARWHAVRPRPFDVGWATGPQDETGFLESVGGGLFARGMASFDRKVERVEPKFDSPEQEVAAAVGELRKTLRQAQPRPWQVTLDGEHHDGHYLLVEAMNIRCIGPNLNLAPAADFSDGQLDVVLLTDADRDRFDEYLRQRMEGVDVLPEVNVRRAANITLEPQGELVHIDDELWPKPGRVQPLSGPIHLRLEPHALMFLIA